jgi:hypothetical protein
MSLQDTLFLIWSFEHGAWWGPDRRGYTPRLDEAGHYSREDASAIVAMANVVTVEEVMVSYDDMIEALPFGRSDFDQVKMMLGHARVGFTAHRTDSGGYIEVVGTHWRDQGLGPRVIFVFGAHERLVDIR